MTPRLVSPHCHRPHRHSSQKHTQLTPGLPVRRPRRLAWCLSTAIGRTDAIPTNIHSSDKHMQLTPVLPVCRPRRHAWCLRIAISRRELKAGLGVQVQACQMMRLHLLQWACQHAALNPVALRDRGMAAAVSATTAWHVQADHNSWHSSDAGAWALQLLLMQQRAPAGNTACKRCIYIHV